MSKLDRAMGTAALVRGYRVRAGKSASEVAAALGINDAWYRDLEHHDDELASTLTLFQAMELAGLLGVRLHDLIAQQHGADASVALMDVPALIEEHLARQRISIDAFEEQVGWDLLEFMRSPIKVAAESPIIFLQALAKHLGIDWLSLVPDDREKQAD